MTISVTREGEGETRVALSPETTKKFKGLGARVVFQAGAGDRSFLPDRLFAEALAEIVESAAEAVREADVLLKVGRPSAEELAALKPSAIVVAMLDPFGARDELEALAAKGVSAFAMEFIPRITRAQSMDVLSSQSNLAGYKAVIDAAAHFGRAFPMMMTAAGTVPAARVFVMGAGVAGLQAIATARRNGAVISATDVRPAAKEQVASLAAKFIAVEDEEFKAAETAGGYAKEMSDEYKKKQAALIASHIAAQDVVITTALIPGRPAPRLVTREMVESMKPGSVIVDLAAERGGNVEGTVPGQIVVHAGVTIMGQTNLAGQVPGNASALYARNLYAFLEPLIDKKDGKLAIKWDDEIIAGTLIAKDGQIVHPRLKGGA
ncbi:NAD(P) transhydrogenase subunit alpha [Rhodomicrobium udaipurense JA643]|uniref:NAD(P) transhydrogenase subunit alpha part 1 n=1 Tax=Rhodomicrobium udaipurense TaxID=1202716 RepID=A0A8I1G9E5_9HYPH|nr:Re/Si-specific NAD(P)(+) transhydrogenase subunit alpha [Rhodomicrobium udaipurense]KAI94645.1 NAD(P) transhydrogenase subunit alpha [Rhodomicrobium udaipurense JA643]MBJ7542973.1 Re/Si-specific NAD(P)(+) transhydrogenase subunit alpha [Rhodomicrobium udaipurense]